jgi:mannan endo-1,4-beta-mannosidase
MDKVRKICGLAIIALVAIGLAQPAWQTQAQATGFHISGRNLVDANGNNFVIRGVAHPHIWFPTQTSSFANIKAAGANTIRVVLSGGRWQPASSASDVANVIQLCKTNRLICVLEDHDTTGFGEDGAAVSLSQAVSYWRSIQSVLTGQEAFVIINIGNEPYGNNNTASWVADTRNAITAMRSAGFRHTLMVDAPNWGQDWQFVMRDNAPSLFTADPDRNTIFSVHMYGVFDTAAEVTNYVSSFVTRGLPLVIGEFGWNHTDGDPDEDTIMAQAQSNGIGYMAWSWSGNGGGVEFLDMVTSFNPSQLTNWGTRVVSGANGLRQTSREASVYGGGGPTNTPTRTATTGPSPTRTRTPTPGGPSPTPTRTPTPGQVGTCSPVTATITAPFTFDGAGTLCWRSSNLGNNINSWNTTSVTVNGVNFTNTFAFTSNLPPKAADGFWYVSYTGNFAWSHFEAK